MGPKRAWRYKKNDWQPAHWWYYFLPQIFYGGSEWGQHTVVQRMPFLGWIVIAWWTCRCEHCEKHRAETMLWELDLSPGTYGQG